MIDAFDALGLSPDADERAIKRAYAAKLKTARPEEDPEGFQRLHDAYREALEVAQWRREPAIRTTEAVEGDTMIVRIDPGDLLDPLEAAPVVDAFPHAPHAPRMPEPPSPPPRHDADASGSADAGMPAFDVDAFLESLEIRIHGSYPEDFERWLANQPDLRRPQCRRAVAVSLADFLATRPTLPRGHVDALRAFFDLDATDDAPAALPSAFDAGPLDAERFLDAVAMAIHRTRPEEFGRWLERHPALYDMAWKHEAALPVLRFIEQRPSMPNGHAEALLSFFGLDQVGGPHMHLQSRVQTVLHRMRTRPPPPTMPPPSEARRPSGSGSPIPVWSIFMLIFLLGKCASAIH